MEHLAYIVVTGIVGLFLGWILKRMPKTLQPLLETVLTNAMAEAEAWAAKQLVKTGEKVASEIKKNKAIEIALEKLEWLKDNGIDFGLELDYDKIGALIQKIFDSWYGKILNSQ